MKCLFIFNLFIIFVNAIQPKLCIKCAFYKKDRFTDNKFGKCLLFPEEVSNSYIFVDGTIDKKIEYNYCATARNMNHMCGQEGKYYKKK
jgi:hypothetical protein